MGWVVFANKIKNIAFQKEPIFLLNGEVIWQASDSPLSKELHGLPKSRNFVKYGHTDGAANSVACFYKKNNVKISI